MREYLNDLQTKKPVVWTGDLNVCHLDGDVWNPDAKHIPTQVEILCPEPSSLGYSKAYNPYSAKNTLTHVRAPNPRQ